MLLDQSNKSYQSFGFRFKGEHPKSLVGIHVIGWDHVTSPTYSWDGLSRSEHGCYVFQYTLSGAGKLQLGEQTYTVAPGNAFLVKLPSQHRYYFSEEHSHWEFIYITLYGGESQHIFHTLQKQYGNIISFSPDSELIKLLFSIYEQTCTQRIADAYQASAHGYAFLMELLRFSLFGEQDQLWPEPISKAALFAQKQYDQPIGLDHLVDVSGLSKYHFTRLFHKTTHTTPLQYLTKIRIDKAIQLLRSTTLTIEEIAQKVGYANGNYFSKVFTKRVGVAPGQFRDSKNAVPVDHIIE